MNTHRAELVQILATTHATLLRLVEGATDAALDARPTPEDWSVREILAHLVDDEMFVMRLRLERLIKEDRPRLTPHDEHVWYVSRNTSRDALRELLADFSVQRAASLGIIALLRESDWARAGYHPDIGVLTADEWLTHWVEHDATHLGQIETTLTRYSAHAPH